MGEIIYHMCREDEWAAAAALGVYRGSSQDKADGFIHFSSKDQIVESAAKHRKGQVGLMLISVDVDVLGDALRWESRRPKLFTLVWRVTYGCRVESRGPSLRARWISCFPEF